MDDEQEARPFFDSLLWTSKEMNILFLVLKKRYLFWLQNSQDRLFEYSVFYLSVCKEALTERIQFLQGGTL